jgi:hypothetical protein
MGSGIAEKMTGINSLNQILFKSGGEGTAVTTKNIGHPLGNH